MNFCEIMAEKADMAGYTLSPLQLDQLDQYYRLMLEWNEKVNLTRITDPEEAAVKHMIDSLSCYRNDVFTTGAKVIDVGSGAGFPGLPLKIYHPDLELTILDSLQKRLLFIQAVTEQLQLPSVFVLHARAEEGGRNPSCREKYTVATARAVARLNILAEYCMPFVTVGGCFAAMKAAKWEEELSESRQAIKVLGGEVDEVRTVQLPGVDETRAVIYIRKVSPTPQQYPRRPGTPEKKPL